MKDKRVTTRQENLIVCFVMLLLAFLICTRCSLNAYYPLRPFTDSSVYLYIAKVIKTGGVAYRDTFDHKGPLLYLINYLGILFGTENGVWMLEILSFFATGWFSYRTMRNESQSALAAIGAIISLLLLSHFFYGGNYTEEYALPFSVCSIYIFYEYFCFGRITSKRLFICGLCWMAVMLIRANMIALWVVFAIAVLVKEIREKSLRIIYFLGWFLLGAICLLAPFILYFAANDALSDFWSDYILFNLTYTRAEGSNWSAVYLYYLRQAPVIISILVLCITAFIDKNAREVAIIDLCFVGVSLLMMSMSGRSYLHYGISLMPIYVIPIAFVLRFFNKQNWNKLVSTIACCAIVIGLLIPWVQYINELPNYQPVRNSAEYVLSCLIADNTEPTDKILACGNSDIFYVYSDRMAASKYSYQVPIAEANPEIYEEVMTQISQNKPEVIIMSNDSVGGILYLDEINSLMESFISNNGYVHWITFGSFSVFGSRPLALQGIE